MHCNESCKNFMFSVTTSMQKKNEFYEKNSILMYYILMISNISLKFGCKFEPINFFIQSCFSNNQTVDDTKEIKKNIANIYLPST